MKCPSLEQIYDMDLDNLISLKQNIELNKINFDIIPLNEDDYDLYDYNSINDKESIINIINSEIKERESTNDLLSFFTNLNFENNINSIENKFISELNSSSSYNRLNKELLKKSITEIQNKENKALNNKNINIFNKNNFNQNHPKPCTSEGLKSLLNRTKIDPTKLQYTVSSNKYVENFWNIDKEKKLRKKQLSKISNLSSSNTNITNYSSKIHENKNIKGNKSRVFSEKIIIGAVDIKKKTKKKKKKISDKNNINDKKINCLELMRNYKVADVTQFLKKKTTNLKPLNSNNIKNNNNCFNNNLNSPNIKVFNKNSLKENKISENNKINEKIENKNQEKKENIKRDDNLIQKERVYNNIEKYYFSFEKGIFKDIKYEAKELEELKNKNFVSNDKYNIKSKFILEKINEISFILTGNYSLKDKTAINKPINNNINENKEIESELTTKNVYNLKDENNKLSQDINKEKLIEGKISIDLNKEREKEIFVPKKDDKEKTINKSINKNEESKNNNIEIEKENEKETELCEEYEEEEEEIGQTFPINNNNNNFEKNNIWGENEDIFEKEESRNSFKKYSLNPIKLKKYNQENSLLKEPLNNNTQKQNLKNSNIQKNLLPSGQISLPKSISNFNEFPKFVLSGVKQPKTSSHYNFLFSKKFKAINQRPKSSLMKNSSIQNNELITENKNIIDYSDMYSNFSELFSGYYLTNNYSQQNNFNLNNAVRELYESFNKLYYYELNHELIQQKDEMYKDIVRAEAGVIINRIKHAEEKLLKEDDININIDKYCLLKKCLELERKNYAREEYENTDISKSKNKKFFRVVLSRPEIYDIVCYTLYKDKKWSELPHGLSLGQCWNLYWSYGPPNIDFTNLFCFQKVNHLINNRIVHRKDLLHKHIMRVRKLNKKCNEAFDIMPLTFLLSKEYVNFVEEFHKIKETQDYNIWIVKPVGKSRGKGIFLIDNISEVPLNDTFLVQKYLTNPLLLDEGYKFDMRIYCLVTSVNPLEMFLYKDGFARVSNELYNLDISNIKVHLTNAAIQNRNAKKSKNFEKIYGGSKISLDMLRTKLAKKYNIDFDYLIWPQVKDIIIKVFACCQNDMPYCPSTFEMFGFDVIIDTNYRCWLLEINSSPSLERSNVLDDEIKIPLVNDIIKLIDPMDIDKEALLNVLERVMKIKNNTKNKDVYLYSPKMQLNLDLNNIFRGKIMRKYGEEPKDMGRFEMICPNKDTDRIIKMTGGQKFYNNKKKKDK